MSKSGIRINVKDIYNANRIKRIVVGNISRVAKNTIYSEMSDLLYDDVWNRVPREVIPVVNKRTGTSRELISNAKITVTKDTPTEYEVVVHFGSDKVSKEYARVQHENLGYHHDIGEANFLQDPFMQVYPVILKKLERDIGGRQ